MGHGSSKSTTSLAKSLSETNINEDSKPSRRARIRQKFRNLRHYRSSNSHSSSSKLITADDFAGIALVGLISAEMKFKDKWFACVSLGERTFRTATSHTDKPVWKSEKKLLLETSGPHIARISVFETNKLSKSNLVGYCELDLFEFLARDSTSESETLDLLDPSSSNIIVGSVVVSCTVEDPIDTEKSFAKRILSIVDYNQDGTLSFSEFVDLINAFGNKTAAREKEDLFKAADKNEDGAVSIDELADLLATQQEKEPLISSCPVCGDTLGKSDKLNDMIHLTLCFDEGTGNQIMTGGFLTEKQASYGWLFKMSEWAHVSSYDVGLNSGSSASSILVFDRTSKRLVEEAIDGKIILSMRAIYQSKIGLGLIDKGAKDLLKNL
ncbi:hypothetical protein MKW92_041106 [Papaver armeniacum]|nr:hypothetical protein MKW92_041106 [Papaver armeniacum]